MEFEALCKHISEDGTSQMDELIKDQQEYQVQLGIFDQKLKEIREKRRLLTKQLSSVKTAADLSFVESPAASNFLDNFDQMEPSQLKAILEGKCETLNNMSNNKDNSMISRKKNLPDSETFPSSSISSCTYDYSKPNTSDLKKEFQQQLNVFNNKHSKFLENFGGIKSLDNEVCNYDKEDSKKFCEVVGWVDKQLHGLCKHHENIGVLEKSLIKNANEEYLEDAEKDEKHKLYEDLIKDVVIEMESFLFNRDV